MSEKTWVYLDVDGVLNAVNWQLPNWGWSDSQVVDAIDQLGVRVSTDLVGRLNRLAERDDVRMFWLTTWCDRAAEMLSPAIGLNGETWPIVGQRHHLDPNIPSMDWWKLHAIRDHLPSGRHAVWIDDDLRFDGDAQTWLIDNPNVVGVSPTTSAGIRPHEMAMIEQACERVGE